MNDIDKMYEHLKHMLETCESANEFKRLLTFAQKVKLTVSIFQDNKNCVGCFAKRMGGYVQCIDYHGKAYLIKDGDVPDELYFRKILEWEHSDNIFLDVSHHNKKVSGIVCYI